MTAILILFWISLFLIFYTHIGYPLVLFIINKFKKELINCDDEFNPTVSLIISAYNEEKIMEKRLKKHTTSYFLLVMVKIFFTQTVLIHWQIKLPKQQSEVIWSF